MNTLDESGASRFAGGSRFARASRTACAARVGLVAVGAFLAAGFMSRPAYAQSQSKQVRERCKRACVEVFTKYSKQTEGDSDYGSGSGYFINRTGLCITNNHVVDPGHNKSQGEKFQLKTKLGRLVWEVVVDSGTDDEKTYRAEVLYQNEKADQALLQVYEVYGEDREYLEWPYYLKFFPGRRLRVGQKAWCYGFPGGDSRTSSKDKHPLVAITSGHIVNLPRRADGDIKMIETDVLANPGNSGGPFVDIDGLLLGTLTLGGQSEGRTNTTMLVPADLSREFITTAFQRGKMPTGIDLEPFYTHLVGADGHVDVPGYPRTVGSDCMDLEGGDRICGSPVGESISLPTPLGRLTFPCAQMAYLLEQDEDYGIILMDGGQRLPFFRDEAEIEFKPTVGKPFTQALNEVRAVAFRKGNPLRDAAVGKNVLIGGSGYHLLLSQVDGEAKFLTNLGHELSLPMETITRIETNEDDERVITISDGSEVSGAFADHEIKAVLAVNGAPQRISLREVRSATIELIDSQAGNNHKRSLAELFEGASPDLREMAQLLDGDDFGAVKARLARHLRPTVFNKLAPLKKDRIRLLDAVFRWRNGDYSGASRQFKKLRRSDDEGIKWYSTAMIAVFKRYPDGTYESRPLSDPEVFKNAGRRVAEDNLRMALEILGERDAPRPESRGLFMRLRKELDQRSEVLMVASRLGNAKADDVVVQIWNFEATLLSNEIRRLEEEIKEKEEEQGGLQGAAREWKGRRLRRDIEDLVKARDVTREWFDDVQTRLANVGFIIDDPDKDID